MSNILSDAEITLEIRPGEDEGSVEVVIENCLGKHVLSATFLISGMWHLLITDLFMSKIFFFS